MYVHESYNFICRLNFHFQRNSPKLLLTRQRSKMLMLMSLPRLFLKSISCPCSLWYSPLEYFLPDLNHYSEAVSHLTIIALDANGKQLLTQWLFPLINNQFSAAKLEFYDMFKFPILSKESYLTSMIPQDEWKNYSHYNWFRKMLRYNYINITFRPIACL